ncbi:hypothetical protein ABZW11_31180 [Nonomuraea sp. NPDC004580]
MFANAGGGGFVPFGEVRPDFFDEIVASNAQDLHLLYQLDAALVRAAGGR